MLIPLRIKAESQFIKPMNYSVESLIEYRIYSQYTPKQADDFAWIPIIIQWSFTYSSTPVLARNCALSPTKKQKSGARNRAPLEKEQSLLKIN